MRAGRAILLFMGLGLACSCQRQEQLPPATLEAYVADPANGYTQSQHIRDVEVRVSYQPADLLALHTLQNTTLTSPALDSARAPYAKSAYFILSLSRSGHEILDPRGGFSDYSQLLQTLAFQMGDHVRLVTEQGDTLRPANYYLDRNYGAASGSQMLFAFALPPKPGTWHFRLNEFGLGTGILDFPFSSRLVQAAPTLLLD